MLMTDQPTRYRHVRALSRGLQLLAELNMVGQATPGDLSRITGIDRTTVYRLLETLSIEGFVCRTGDNTYGLTVKVNQLSEGFNDEDRVTRFAAHALGQLFPKVLWPNDFAVFDQGRMVIRESTHRFSPFSVYRAVVGRQRPVLTTALGRAVLSAASPAERRLMLDQIAKSGQPDCARARDEGYVDALVAAVLKAGYASSVGLVETGTSAIALPIKGPNRVYGAINLIFFRSAMTPEEASERYLPDMRKAVTDIEAEIRKDK